MNTISIPTLRAVTFSLVAMAALHLNARADFYLQVPKAPQIPMRAFKVIDYGAKGDGTTMNTEAFSKAIEACAKAGGGNVVVTSGTFVTGPIRLVSKMALIVEKDAVIQASHEFTDFGLP